jgi:hypothetical protein
MLLQVQTKIVVSLNKFDCELEIVRHEEILLILVSEDIYIDLIEKK